MPFSISMHKCTSFPSLLSCSLFKSKNFVYPAISIGKSPKSKVNGRLVPVFRKYTSRIPYIFYFLWRCMRLWEIFRKNQVRKLRKFDRKKDFHRLHLPNSSDDVRFGRSALAKALSVDGKRENCSPISAHFLNYVTFIKLMPTGFWTSTLTFKWLILFLMNTYPIMMKSWGALEKKSEQLGLLKKSH